MYNSQCMILKLLTPFDEYPTDDLYYFSKHEPVSINICDTLGKESSSDNYRCFEAAPISFTFSNAFGGGETATMTTD